MGSRDKYNDAIQAAKGHMEGGAEERDGKLYFKRTTKTQAEANKIWDAIKTVPEWADEIAADIKAGHWRGGGGFRGAYLHGQIWRHAEQHRQARTGWR